MGEVRRGPTLGCRELEGRAEGEETQQEVLEVPARQASQASQLRTLEPHSLQGAYGNAAAFPTLAHV